MTIINNYEEFAELQKKYPRTLTNDYMMPGEIRKFIEHGKLSCIANEGGLFTFIERDGFCKLIFRLRDDSAALPPIDKPLAAYLVYREGKPLSDAENWLAAQGFAHSVKLERYVWKTINNVQCTIDNYGENFAKNARFQFDKSIETATADETYSMLYQHFGAEEMDLPPQDMFSRESTYCVRGDDGSLLGVVYDMGHTRIIAVSPAARGMGIGGKLYRAYMAQVMLDGKNPIFYEWIRPDNSASIAMFRKLGFERDSLVTDCYVRR
ncbi:MAG: GNAT family N-acetyltransferase [Oscillospiraceae bacterium]|nr:GNAT family N-acetyltransferase [Oscillospiraceae bacterium]